MTTTDYYHWEIFGLLYHSHTDKNKHMSGTGDAEILTGDNNNNKSNNNRKVV